MIIPNQEFILPEIENYHPSSNNYLKYWRNLKHQCIEGRWASGKWMPGKLFSYTNFGTIRLNRPGMKTKILAQPRLRDIEWQVFYNWEEARGFSGFEDDSIYTCHRAFTQEYLSDEDIIQLYCLGSDYKPDPIKVSHLFRPDGVRKKFIPAREYMRQQHSQSLGSPLYMNYAKNFMMLGPRGYGKSYMMGAGIVLHEWLFDGLQQYDSKRRTDLPTTDIIVGAGDAKYSNDTLKKTRISLENLPGSQEIAGTYYPSPLSKQYAGSWGPGKDIVATYKIKEGGSWVHKGSGSRIKNRTFKDNPFAGQGSRASAILLEEIGMFDNARQSYAALVDVMKDGSFKYGTLCFIGTGGDMSGGGTQDAHYIFYHPWEFDCLEFEDIWEGQGSIGYFVSAEYGLDQFKDSNGITNQEKAREHLLLERKRLSSSRGSSMTLQAEIVYHPLKPSEIFLLDQGNIFPVAELQNRLTQLKASSSSSLIEKKVILYFDSENKINNGVSYKLDTSNQLTPIDEWPWTHQSREGAIVIYELPLEDPETNTIPKDLYIIGHDPYRTDSTTGQSLGSIYVLKTSLDPTKYGHDEIVAQYVGRPFRGRNEVNEILLKLSLFYGNAPVYFENAVGNVKEYFEKRHKLSLLAKQPQTILTKKASFSTSEPTVYGYPMSNKNMKLDLVYYLRDWLLEERAASNNKVVRNLDLIPDQALLQELIAFNMEGNFDRVMGFGGCIIGLEERYNKFKEELFKPRQTNSYQFITDNKFLFPGKIHTLEQTHVITNLN